MFHTIDTFEAHQVSLPFVIMIAIFLTISFTFKLLLLYLRISQFIVHSQMSYFSMCLLQHLWKKTNPDSSARYRVIPTSKTEMRKWKDCSKFCPINLYYPLNEKIFIYVFFTILFSPSAHVLFSQCYSLININSGKAESGQYFLRFSSFRIQRYCNVSLVVELKVDQIKAVFIVCINYLDSCIMVNDLFSMFLPPPVPDYDLKLLLHLAQILSVEQGLLWYSFTWNRGDPGGEERIRLVLPSVPSLALVVILVTAVWRTLVVGQGVAKVGGPRGVHTSLRLERLFIDSITNMYREQLH